MAGHLSLRRAARALFLAAMAATALAVSAHAQERAERIVAIGGSIVEIVYALGEEARLVARDSTAVFPQEATRLPDVGYMRALSPEGVLSVDPDLIVALEGAGPPEAIEVLERAGVPLATVPETYDRRGVIAKIAAVGEAFAVPDKAQALAARIEADIRAAEAAAAASGERPRVMFILSVQGGRIMASGSGTAADGIIALAGARNAVEGFEGYKQLTEEAVIEARPDFILMMERTGEHDMGEGDLAAHPAIASTPAGRGGGIIRMDGAYLLGFGPRTASAVRDLAARLHEQRAEN